MSQFMEVIEFLDPTGEEMVHRVPEEGSGETKFGARCIVRDSQSAIFFKDGRGVDVLGPGSHSLSTKNLPMLTKLLMLPWGFESIFKAEVYFVNRKVFTSLRWGTRDPVAFKDSQLGMVRLRAFGAYTFSITEPLLFVNTLVGTQGVYTPEQIKDYLRDVIISRLNDLMGETLDSIFELPKSYDEIAAAVRARLLEDFSRYGLELRDFYINSITPPEEVQKIIDQRSGMGAVGDVDKFLKFQAAVALGDSGKSGGAIGAAVGLGAGAGIGMMMPGMMKEAMFSGAATVAVPRAACPKCHGEVPDGARFCSSCGHQMVVVNKCTKCGKDLPPEANFCMVCGSALSAKHACPKCNTILPPGTKFCTACGERVQE
ncbi:MAG TPA: SPFH domain-containing protein [Nitrospirota bacterium]|jgi:membrane protease subunit (stomatin/prohibitin family)